MKLFIRRPSLYLNRYHSLALAELIRDLGKAWSEYQRALAGPSRTLSTNPPDYKILELAVQPAYWLEMFSAALCHYDSYLAARPCATSSEDVAGQPRTLSQLGDRPANGEGFSQGAQGSSEHRLIVRAGTRRKMAEDAGEAMEADGGAVSANNQTRPRRSKRLKASIP